MQRITIDPITSKVIPVPGMYDSVVAPKYNNTIPTIKTVQMTAMTPPAAPDDFGLVMGVG